jgi:hypothetical protein
VDYQDFTIDLRSNEGGGFEASVAEAPMRDALRVAFAAPLEQGLLEHILGIFDRPGEAIRHEASRLNIRPHQVGGQLFTALFADGLGELFMRCRDAVAVNGKAGLRLRLRFRTDDPEAEYLAALPWEWLWDPRASEFLASDPCTPVVREISAPRHRGTLELDPPLRILVVDAAPATLRQLGLKLEIERMTEALQPLVAKGQAELRSLPNATPETMRDLLLEEEIHVLHFMGHGGFDRGSGAGAVFFVKPDGTMDQVDGEMLAAFLKRIPSLRLVVLNSCKTARHAGRVGAPLNHGVATAVLERTGVPAVLANQYSISDGAAIAFSNTFYRRIAAEDGVDEALTEARLRLRERTFEWATPVLFLTAPSGKLFSIARRRRQRPSAKRAAHRNDTPVRLGVRSIDGWGRDMKDRTDALLDLVGYFNDRYIKDKACWQEKIFPELRDFLMRSIEERRPLLLDFAAHSSIAFAAGWLLEPKSGLDVRVRQRIGSEGEFEWHPNDGTEPAGAGLWIDRPDIEVEPVAPDIAVALAVSQLNVADQVREFVRSEALPVGRILDAAIAPEPGPRAVRGGAHALRLAQALLPRLQPRHPHERGGRVHFFCAAPNALMFYLGQLASSLGRIVLYEYPFRAADAYGRYQKSIELPPPGEVRRVPEGW